MKAAVSVVKTEPDGSTPVKDAVFGLYTAESMTFSNTQIPADTLLASVTTGEDGTIEFNIDLPLGSYYVKELSAPAGYVLSDEIVTISFDGSQTTETMSVEAAFTNDYTKVQVSKKDQTTGEELAGATHQPGRKRIRRQRVKAKSRRRPKARQRPDRRFP